MDLCSSSANGSQTYEIRKDQASRAPVVRSSKNDYPHGLQVNNAVTAGEENCEVPHSNDKPASRPGTAGSKQIEWCALVCRIPGQQDTCPYKQGELAVCEIMGDSIAAKQSKYKILKHLVKLCFCSRLTCCKLMAESPSVSLSYAALAALQKGPCLKGDFMLPAAQAV